MRSPVTHEHQRLVRVSDGNAVGAAFVVLWHVFGRFVVLGVAVLGAGAIGGALDLVLALPIAVADGDQFPFLRNLFGDGPKPWDTFGNWITGKTEPLWHESVQVPEPCR